MPEPCKARSIEGFTSGQREREQRLLLVVMHLVVRMLLVAMPGAPSSDALAPSSKARSH